MATMPLEDQQTPAPTPPSSTQAAPTILVCLPSMPTEAQSATAEHLAAAFPNESLSIAGLHLDYTQPRSTLGWVLAAADYAAAAPLAQNLSAILILGPDASTLPAITLRDLIEQIRSGTDLAIPRYPVGPHDALIASSILYPLTRALFSADIRFPLPADAALSPRLLSRLASAALRSPRDAQGESLLWPVSEAAIAGFKSTQVDTEERVLTAPSGLDLNTLLASICGSLFADLEAKAIFWQRGRNITPVAGPSTAATPDQAAPLDIPDDIRGMIDGFRLASNNLTEIWSLVLPPQTLLALKKLSRTPHEDFALDPALWARIVYDFALAFHLRTLNRGHLLGAMTPLYLAWVASHIRAAADDSARSARLIEATAQAFEREKPYLVSRWRWPDRFNP